MTRHSDPFYLVSAQAYARGYLVRRRLSFRSPAPHRSPRSSSPNFPKAPVHTVPSASNFQRPFSPNASGAVVILEATPRPASASARALSPARESSYGSFRGESGALGREEVVPRRTVPAPPENETKDQRIFRVSRTQIYLLCDGLVFLTEAGPVHSS